jgi:hypothetical protein
LGTQGVGAGAQGREGRRAQGVFQTLGERGDAGTVAAHHVIQGGCREIDVADEPDDPVHEQVLQLAIEPQLQGARDLGIEGIHRALELHEAEGVPGRGIGRGDRGSVGARLVGEAAHDGRPAAIHDGVGELGRDDLAAQTMRGDGIGEAPAHLLGEIALELAAEIGIVGDGALQELVVEGELGIGEEHRKLGPGEALAQARPLGQGGVVGQEFDRAVEPPLALQSLHQPLDEAEIARALGLGEREREALEIVVAQDEAPDLVGHLGEERVARGLVEASRRARARSRRS